MTDPANPLCWFRAEQTGSTSVTIDQAYFIIIIFKSPASSRVTDYQSRDGRPALADRVGHHGD